MIDKFYEIKELKDTKLKMIDSCRSNHDIPIGETYLQSEVINMWDFKDYSNFYTYFDDGIHFVVNICVRIDIKTTRTERLEKDLNNIR